MNQDSNLSNFDRLPNAAVVGIDTVAALCDCGVSTVWARCARGALPKPRKIGRSARWNVGELRKVLFGEGVAA